MTVYGYIREKYPVPITEQLKALSSYKCDKLYAEHGELTRDSELKELMHEIKEEDVLVIYSFQSLGKTLKGLLQLLESIAERNIRLLSIEDHVDFQQDNSVLTLVQTLYTVELDLRRGYRRASPDMVGRPRIDLDKVEKIRNLHKNKMSMRRIADECDVSLGTVWKYLHMETD